MLKLEHCTGPPFLTRAIVCSLKWGSFTAFFKRCNTSGQERVGMQIFGGGHLPVLLNSGEDWDRLTNTMSSKPLAGMDPGIGRRQWHLTLQAARSRETIIRWWTNIFCWYLSMRKYFRLLWLWKYHSLIKKTTRSAVQQQVNIEKTLGWQFC